MVKYRLAQHSKMLIWIALTLVNTAIAELARYNPLILNNGQRLENARIIRVEPDGLYIVHRSGAGIVDFDEIPDQILSNLNLPSRAERLIQQDRENRLRHQRELQENERRMEVQRQTDEISSALTTVNRIRTYTEAIQFLEDAIDKNPQAQNLNEARVKVRNLRQEFANRQAQEIRARQEEQRRREEEARRLEREEQQRIQQNRINENARRRSGEIPTVINSALERQSIGQDGREYFSGEALRLYAPVNWEIVAEPVIAGSLAYVTLRIESSTRGGFPIRRLWIFEMTFSETRGWLIRNIVERN